MTNFLSTKIHLLLTQGSKCNQTKDSKKPLFEIRRRLNVKSYSGKYIWIIGASSGIGEALAKSLAKKGANLILSSRRREALEKVNNALENTHTVLPVDVTDIQSLYDAARTIKKLDSVIFLAAIYSPNAANTKSISYTSQMIQVNLTGVFNTVYTVLPFFQKQGFGQIALCASIAGYRGLPYSQPYAATKAGIINYAESLKIELEDKKIDVKVINPGFVKTPMTNKNKFSMPLMISAEQAATAITRGLISNRFEIHFPKRVTLIMKIISSLPSSLYFYLARLMKKIKK